MKFISLLIIIGMTCIGYIIPENFLSDPISMNYDNDRDTVADVYPVGIGLPMMLQPEGDSNGTSAYNSHEKQDLNWFGLFKDNNKIYIESVKLTVVPAYAGVNGDDQDDPTTWSGLNVTTNNKDTAIILIGDPKGNALKEGLVDKAFIIDRIIDLEDIISIEMNGISYKLFSTGMRQLPRSEECYYGSIYNFRLYLQAEKNGKVITQLLASAPYFNGILFTLIFAGDLDGDQIPDFLIDTAYEYMIYSPYLYLSSYADGDELVKVVANYETYGC